MELNRSALAKNINNITSMSELFVASTRTQFSDFVHSGGPIIINPQAHLTASTTNSTQSSSGSSTSSNMANQNPLAGQSGSAFSHHYHLHHQGLVNSVQLAGTGVLEIPQHHSSINSSNLLLNNNPTHSQMHSTTIASNQTNNGLNSGNNENNFGNNQQHQIHNNYLSSNHITSNANTNSNTNNNNNSNNDSNANNSSAGNDNDSISNNTTTMNTNNNLNTNNKNDNTNGNSNNPSNHQQNRLSQPVRTQIPIHCYIEQLDACADMPGYSTSLNDNDLFNTVSNNQYKTTSPNPSNDNQAQSHNPNQPHLHQSKLALESVTNCTNTSSSNNIFSRQQNLASTSNNASQSNSQANQHNDNMGKFVPSADTNQQTYPRCRDKIAIVTSNVLFIDLVRAVLPQLGYSAMDLINAKATIQIKNWKPLALDQVTEDKRATVGDVLADISTFVTLRIRLYSSVSQLPTEWTETMIRQVVLALTQTMSQLTLSKLCNISQPLISSIVRGNKKLGRRKCAEFGQWYMNYIKSAEARPSSMFCEGSGARLVFDKTREIPQLKAWFQNNTKPSDETLEEYSRILNDNEIRKDSTTIKPQITAKALRNWWKNERQKLGIRQREIRGRPKLKRIEC